MRQVLQALEDHQWDWTAWDLHPAASPCLIKDWKYTPTPFFGQWVKKALWATCRVHAPPAPESEARLPRGTIGPLASSRPAWYRRSSPGPWRGDEPSGSSRAIRTSATCKHPGSVVYDKAAGTYTVVRQRGQHVGGPRRLPLRLEEGVSGDWRSRPTSPSLGQGKEPHRKACLVIRQDLDADSAYVDAALHGDGLTSLQFRDSKGDLTHEVQANVSAPKRLRIEKKGKYVRLYVDSGSGPGILRARPCGSSFASRSTSASASARTTPTSPRRRCSRTWS